jgi:hypothetical protein
MRRGAFHLKKGMPVDFVASDAEGTEIVYQRKHLLADDPLFCPVCGARSLLFQPTSGR